MPASASVDSSPKPGGDYRLKPGLYVQKDVTCANAPNAAIRRYDGRTISDANSQGFRDRFLNRKGDRYKVLESCVGAGGWAWKMVSLRNNSTIRVRSEMHRVCQ